MPMDPRKRADEIMDQACLPEVMVKNGLDKALRESIALAIRDAQEIERVDMVNFIRTRPHPHIYKD